MKILLIFFLTAFSIAPDGLKFSLESIKKLNKSIEELYPGHSVQIVNLNLSDPEISDVEILNADGKWFAIQENKVSIGWMMADRIWGRYHEFEYAMFIDTSTKIIHPFRRLNYCFQHLKPLISLVLEIGNWKLDLILYFCPLTIRINGNCHFNLSGIWPFV